MRVSLHLSVKVLNKDSIQAADASGSRWSLSRLALSNKIRPSPHRFYYPTTLLHYISIYEP